MHHMETRQGFGRRRSWPVYKHSNEFVQTTKTHEVTVGIDNTSENVLEGYYIEKWPLCKLYRERIIKNL
jgi:hypothetical protein